MGLTQATPNNPTPADAQGRNTPAVILPPTSHGLGLGFPPSAVGHSTTSQDNNPVQSLQPNPAIPAPGSGVPVTFQPFPCNCPSCNPASAQNFAQNGIRTFNGLPSSVSTGPTSYPIQSGPIVHPPAIPLPSNRAVTIPPPTNGNTTTLPPPFGPPFNGNPVATDMRPLPLVQNPLSDSNRNPGGLTMGLQPSFPDTASHLMPMGSRLPTVPPFARPQAHIHHLNGLPGLTGEASYPGTGPKAWNDSTPFTHGMTCSKGFGMPPFPPAAASVVPPLPGIPPIKVEDQNDLATQLGYLTIKPSSLPAINPPVAFPPQHSELTALAAQISADAKPYDTAAELVTKITKARCLAFPNEWQLSIRTHHCTIPPLTKLTQSKMER